MSILIRMELLYDWSVVLLCVGLFLHALEDEIHRGFQELVNQIHLFKSISALVAMLLYELFCQFIWSFVDLALLVLKALLLFVHVVSYVLRSLVKELLLSKSHKTNMFLLIFVSYLSLMFALCTFAIQAWEWIWIQFTVVPNLMNVASSGAGEDNMAPIEASNGLESVHITNLYALGVVFIAFLAPELIAKRFIYWLLLLNKPFQLIPCLAKTALKFWYICFPEDLLCQIEIMTVLTVKPNWIVALAIAESILGHALAVVDFGKSLSFLENPAELWLLVVKVSDPRWLIGDIWFSLNIARLRVHLRGFGIAAGTVNTIEILERWKITNWYFPLTWVQSWFMACSFGHEGVVRSVHWLWYLAHVILANVWHKNVFVRFCYGFAHAEIWERGTFLAV